MPIKVYNDKKQCSEQEMEKQSTFTELYTDADEKESVIDVESKNEWSGNTSEKLPHPKK